MTDQENKDPSLHYGIDDASSESADGSAKQEAATGFFTFQKFATDAIELIDDMYSKDGAPPIVGTGFPELDELTRGLRPGELTVIAGKSKSARTAFASQVASNICRTGESRAAYYSLGLTGEELAMRMISSDGMMDHARLMNGALTDEDWPRLTHAIQRLDDFPLHVCDSGNLSAQQMCENAKSLAAAQGKLEAVFIDPFPPFSMLDETCDGADVYRALLSFKLLAKELSCPVVVVAPVKMTAERRTAKRPAISDLWFCKEFDAVADTVLLFDRYVLDAASGGVCDTVEIRVERQRSGPEGSVMLGFDAFSLTFFDVSKRQCVPLLDGSAKQIEYAEAIRERHRESFPTSPNLFQRASSTWWIENREAL